MIEWFGTAMSVIVALSLMQKKIKTLRIINLIGAVGFASYGLLIKAWPVLGLNAFIALVDIYYLTEIVRSQDFFSYISGKLDNSKYCQRFIEFYRDDMESYFPGQLQIKGLKYCLILRNMIPVSIILLQEHSSDEAEIVVDYATPSYRDLRNAQFFLHEIIP
nr:hypothetical protein [Spirochaetaceae bacterium]